MQEDPVEDVFVSNVMSEFGNHRVFEGIWESNDFYAQEIIDVLNTLPEDHRFEKLKKHVFALLAVSEALAGRADLQK